MTSDYLTSYLPCVSIQLGTSRHVHTQTHTYTPTQRIKVLVWADTERLFAAPSDLPTSQ